MKSTRHHLLVSLAAALLTLFATVLASLPATMRAPFTSVLHADPKGIKYTGLGDCNTASCHGASKPAPNGNSSSNEATIYEKVDLHARSYASKDGKKGLLNPLSKKIAANLGIKKAEDDARCLSCHALSGFSNGAAKTRIPLTYANDVLAASIAGKKFLVKQGVNCDGCHGPADNYLPQHTVKGWTDKQRAAMSAEKLYDNFGLYDTKNLKLRANACVSCHLKIDADLIKADHPELPFELDKFCHGEWMHWRPSGDYYGAKAWAMGQFVSLREAALQLAERMKAGDAVDQGLRLDSYKQLVAHLLMARHPAKWIAADMEAELTKQLAIVNDNWKDVAKVAPALQEIGKTADALADKLLPMKLAAAAAEKLLQCVAADGEVAVARGFRASQQYWYALTALQETNFLKGAAPDPKTLAATLKGDAKGAKIAELEDMATSAEAFKKGEAFLAKVKEIMPLFGGGCPSVALPPNAPDAGPGQVVPPTPPEPPVPTPPTPPVPTPPVPTPPVPTPPVPTPPVPTPPVPTPPVPTPPVPTPPVPPPPVPNPGDSVVPQPPPQPVLTGKQFCPECGRPFPFQYKYCPVDGTKLARIVDDKKP